MTFDSKEARLIAELNEEAQACIYWPGRNLKFAANVAQRKVVQALRIRDEEIARLNADLDTWAKIAGLVMECDPHEPSNCAYVIVKAQELLP